MPNNLSGQILIVAAGKMSKPGAAHSEQLKNEKSTGGLTTSKRGGDAQLINSMISPQNASQGERHPDLLYDAQEAAVPAMLLHALLHPACYQSILKLAQQWAAPVAAADAALAC